MYYFGQYIRLVLIFLTNFLSLIEIKGVETNPTISYRSEGPSSSSLSPTVYIEHQVAKQEAKVEAERTDSNSRKWEKNTFCVG